MENDQNNSEDRLEVDHFEQQAIADSIDTNDSRRLGDALVNMDTNMVKMATVLQKIYERQCSMDSISGNNSNSSTLPPASSSQLSSHNMRDSSGQSSRQNDDDRISIFASGDEQGHQDDLDADVDQLTGQNTVVNDQLDTELLQDLANELEEDEPTGPSINQSLADIANKRWGKQLGPDKVKTLLNKYKRPENCGNIAEIRVNTEIWNQLSAQKKKTDLQLSNIQQTARKVLFANLQMTSVLMEAGRQMDTKSLLAQVVDSVALLGHISHNLSQLRRDQIRPALKSDYASICSSSSEHNDSKYLFGDDLPKRLREAKESCRIGNTMSHNTRHHNRKPYARESYTNTQRPFTNRPQYRKQGKDFFWKGQSRPTKRKTMPPAERK